ncbi:uncharacterized protein LOC117810313 [Notolabrus celidotus]|uniref:uncharacterized protein LOC117810313 n=1 Tax=Notolabrus celidotus TaxID=1203425 RepID=UPI00148FC35E|nr:uncharacterized protein LOC117810313 [Notolabrus celidotus]
METVSKIQDFPMEEDNKNKARKKGKNKEKKNLLPAEELSLNFGSWDKRISDLRCKTTGYRGYQDQDRKGKKEEGTSNNKGSESEPKCNIIQENMDAPQQAALPEGEQQQAASLLAATQHASGDDEMMMGPVVRRKVRPQQQPCQPAPTEQMQARGVNASPQQARGKIPALMDLDFSNYVPKCQPTSNIRTEQINEPNKGDQAGDALITQLKEIGICARIEQETQPMPEMTFVSELEREQLKAKNEEKNIRLTMQNYALAGQVQHLTEELQKVTTQHEQIKVRKELEIQDLEFQLLVKKLSKSDMLKKVKKIEEDLWNQKQSCLETELQLAQQREDKDKMKNALSQTTRDLENQRLLWEEERAKLQQSIRTNQQAVEDNDNIFKEGSKKLAELEEKMKTLVKKPKKPSLWRRFTSLFK